jgi:hypothetical protein
MAPGADRAVTFSRLGRKRVKPTPTTGTVQITFRLDVDTVRQIDAEAERIARENPGLTIGRTEILRMFINEALARRTKSRGK